MNLKIVDRFIKRMHLSEHQYRNLDFKIKTFREFKSNNNFNPKGEKCIQLYHSIRSPLKNEVTEIVDSIEKNGFQESIYGNKGPGVYFANHSRYSILWGGGNNAVICDVVAANNSIHAVNRYRSEIISGSTVSNSEYVITDTSIICPRYFIEYEINKKICREICEKNNWSGFVEHGKMGRPKVTLCQEGCENCDRLGTRCDCKQIPAIDCNDLDNTF